MNRFFKPALSLLLDLKLGNCPIDRRLDPLKTFLTRHCTALKKYLYPECFNKLVNCLWCYILEVCRSHAHFDVCSHTHFDGSVFLIIIILEVKALINLAKMYMYMLITLFYNCLGYRIRDFKVDKTQERSRKES